MSEDYTAFMAGRLSTKFCKCNTSPWWSTLLLCCDARSSHSLRPCHCHPCTTCRSGRRPLCGRGVRSCQAATPDPESNPAAVTETAAMRSLRRRIVRSFHASCSHDSFCHSPETFDPIESPPSAEKKEVPYAVLAKTHTQARGRRGRPEKSSMPSSTRNNQIPPGVVRESLTKLPWLSASP